MPTNQELTWESLTAALDETETPNDFIKTAFFSRHNTNTTEKINVDTWVGGRKMAPFVHPGAEAIMVPGRSKRFKTIEAPNIRIKQPFTSQEIFFSRTPGSPIFVGNGASQLTEIQRAIAGDVRYMREQIDDTTEWMCCQALSGVVTYNPSAFTPGEAQIGDSFTIDFGMPAANKITLTTTDRWSEPEATATQTPRRTLLNVQKIINAKGLGAVTDCVLGAQAAAAFEEHFSVAKDLDNRRFNAGAMDLDTRYRESGARYIGRLYGIDWWEYSRQVEDPFGGTVDLIASNKAHFISRSSDMVLEFGAILDLKAYREGTIAGEVFSKSWEEEDPSVMMHLATSRPLPVLRRPEGLAVVTVL